MKIKLPSSDLRELDLFFNACMRKLAVRSKFGKAEIIRHRRTRHPTVFIIKV